ncbi:MAG: creatininase family protein [Methanomassiliicoccales archaeon]|nr:MAG: creatininase family protein [Methanomassiliicoccales archaeon]
MMFLDDLSTKEFEREIDDNTVVILPIGVIEEHGSHLPLSTDSLQGEYVAEEVARRTGALIAPPIRYGVCNTTRNFSGTVSIRFETLRSLVLDVLSEFGRNGIKNVVVLSGHAGSTHLAALRLAAKDVVDKNDMKILVLSDYEIIYEKGFVGPEDGHSGSVETSRVMAIRPDLIKGKGKKGVNRIPKYMVLRHPEKYWKGVTGDPAKATKKKGEELNELIIQEMVKMINDMRKMEV